MFPRPCTSLFLTLGVSPNGPLGALEGLDQYSHVWLIFVFHENTNGAATVKAKVTPPKLGSRVGVFSTRSPHRPNAIGLTLARLDKVTGDTLHLAGADLVDGVCGVVHATWSRCEVSTVRLHVAADPDSRRQALHSPVRLAARGQQRPSCLDCKAKCGAIRGRDLHRGMQASQLYFFVKKY